MGTSTTESAKSYKIRVNLSSPQRLNAVHGPTKELSSTRKFSTSKHRAKVKCVEQRFQPEVKNQSLKRSKKLVVLMLIQIQLVTVTVQHGQKDKPSLMFYSLLLMSNNGSKASPKLGKSPLRMV